LLSTAARRCCRSLPAPRRPAPALQRIAQCGERAVLLGQLGEIDSAAIVSCYLHGAVEFGNRRCFASCACASASRIRRLASGARIAELGRTVARRT